MKPNPNLDELLSSFIDGELSPVSGRRCSG